MVATGTSRRTCWSAAPAAHPEEFDGKPDFHRFWTTGFRGTEWEWTNPGWSLFSRVEQCTILAHYYGMVAQLDHAIGRILDALARRGLAEDTLVVFTGDHGDFMGDHSMMLKAPIHYESLIRVPLILRPRLGRHRHRRPGRHPSGADGARRLRREPAAAMEGRLLRDGPRRARADQDDMRGSFAFGR